MKRFFFLLIVCAIATWTAVAQAPAGHLLLLEPAQVWTAGEPLHTGWVVLIEGNQIKAVGPQASVSVPPDAEHIALPGMTVLPGLMDLHSHLFLHPYNEKLWDLQVLTEPPQYRTILATKHAEATLMAGFTTLRDLGTEGAGFGDVAMKRAIHEGIIPGPRLWVATRARMGRRCGITGRIFRCRRVRRSAPARPNAWPRCASRQRGARIGSRFTATTASALTARHAPPFHRKR
jgi:imidazolonepropionase-like amidohydrolase